jgi:hypothetical protein
MPGGGRGERVWEAVQGVTGTKGGGGEEGKNTVWDPMVLVEGRGGSVWWRRVGGWS